MNNPGDMPPKPPPPMAPPPGMPPSGPPPYGTPPGPYGYGAPPPPPKSNTMKWVLIGCGIFGLLGVLCCGGIFVGGYFTLKAAVNQAMAQVKPVIESNESVKGEIGAIKELNPRWEAKASKHNGRDSVQFTLDVVGEKGKGIITVDMTEVREDVVHATLYFKSDKTPDPKLLGTYEISNSGWKKVEPATE